MFDLPHDKSIWEEDDNLANATSGTPLISLAKRFQLDLLTLTSVELAATVNAFDEIVLYYTLTSHLFWGTWAIVQAGMSSIDFDFIGYSKLRYDGYHFHKELFGINCNV